MTESEDDDVLVADPSFDISHFDDIARIQKSTSYDHGEIAYNYQRVDWSFNMTMFNYQHAPDQSDVVNYSTSLFSLYVHGLWVDSTKRDFWIQLIIKHLFARPSFQASSCVIDMRSKLAWLRVRGHPSWLRKQFEYYYGQMYGFIRMFPQSGYVYKHLVIRRNKIVVLARLPAVYLITFVRKSIFWKMLLNEFLRYFN